MRVCWHYTCLSHKGKLQSTSWDEVFFWLLTSETSSSLYFLERILDHQSSKGFLQHGKDYLLIHQIYQLVCIFSSFPVHTYPQNELNCWFWQTSFSLPLRNPHARPMNIWRPTVPPALFSHYLILNLRHRDKFEICVTVQAPRVWNVVCAVVLVLPRGYT